MLLLLLLLLLLPLLPLLLLLLLLSLLPLLPLLPLLLSLLPLLPLLLLEGLGVIQRTLLRLLEERRRSTPTSEEWGLIQRTYAPRRGRG
jgi:hypothetical protein